MRHLIKKFFNDESGSTAIEYCIIAAGLSIVIVTVVNNLFFSTSGFNDMVIGLPTETTGLAMSHNLWFAQGMATTAGVYSDIAFAGEPASLYAGNPLLNGAPTNLRPSVGSPAIGKGLALPFASANFDGVAWSAAPNIGAY